MTEQHHLAADRLEAYVEGLLDQADRVIVESHLVSCGQCRHEVDEWLALFAALSDLPDLEPSAEFADRVMSRVRITPRRVWRRQVAQAGAFVARVLPKTTAGWGFATALLALPMVLGGALLLWLDSKSFLTPEMALAFFSTQVVDGARALAAGAASTLMQTDIVAWAVEYAPAFLETAGMTGIGALLAGAGAVTMLSIWVLYRNVFRTPSRDTDYALFTL